MLGESGGGLAEKVAEILGSKDYGQLVEEIFKPENLPGIHTEGMDLITKICENGLKFTEDDAGTTACTKALMHVVHNYRPKEALICLLEQGEAFVNSEKFTFLLPALQYVMLSLPKKREKTFSWVLSTLKSHAKYFYQVPDEMKSSFFDPSEAILREQDGVIKSILQTYRDYIDFYFPFVQQLGYNSQVALESGDQESIESVQRQREYLRDYLVDLLGVPLIHLNLDWTPTQTQEAAAATTSTSANANNANEESAETETETPKNVKTEARVIAEKIMSMLQIVDLNPSYYFGWLENRVNVVNDPEVLKQLVRPPSATNSYNNFEDEDDDEDEIIIHMSSIASYYYLIFVQGLETQQMSSVYSPTYMFNTILHPVTTVLKNVANSLAIHKAIKLALKFLSFCDISATRRGRQISYGHRFHHNLLKKEVHGLFIDRLAYLVVYCPVKQVRSDAYLLLKNYMMAFDPQGKHDFLHHIFNEIPSDTLVGEMIVQLKQFIFIALHPRNVNYEEGMKEVFLGKTVSRMILSICYLKEGATTDLCQNTHKIVCTMNLLRYLLICDKVENKTGILDLFPKIEEILLNPLRAGLNISRAHYELKLKEINDPHLRKEMENEETKMFQNLSCDIKIGGETVKQGDISLKEQKASMVNAINNFDHMTGLLAWVYEAQQQTTK